ncbi:MAG TPA: hypothetical protein VFM58_02630 [Solirubrobacteraceae bacterium]|jgi:hypothetical protein|nr:hypothetical protein [Solirubrobacteraceae bacterium]
MRRVPPADPRRDEVESGGRESPPPGPRPAATPSRTGRVSAAALVITLVALAVIAVLVIV